MAKNYYVSGQWNVTCDRCSRKVKSGEIRKEWTGFLVCNLCYEMRHPQDFVRAKQDKIYVPDTRPIPALIFAAVPNILRYVDDGYIYAPNPHAGQDYILESY